MNAGWRWGRVVLGAAVLGVVVWRLGGGPFLAGLRAVDVPVVAVAVTLNAIATVAAAARWRAVAAGLGAELPLPAAIGAYYRAQLLNVTLPGGVLGDVHRGLRHGRDTADVGRGVRAVVTERVAGQVVQLGLTGALLSLFPSPFRVVGALVLAGLAVTLCVALVLAREAVRAVLSNRLVLGTSAVVCLAHLTTFVVAAQAVPGHLPPARLLPVAALVLLATAVPLNVGGWGPREGVAAWAFAGAGSTAAIGVAAATVYGVLVVAASLPGVAVLVRPRRRLAAPPARPAARVPVGSGCG
jgi:uncharacterized membrane protein YbhN (UPF0104 family)